MAKIIENIFLVIIAIGGIVMFSYYALAVIAVILCAGGY
jgi:cytochrome b subunit of formate dehydrogenase